MLKCKECDTLILEGTQWKDVPGVRGFLCPPCGESISHLMFWPMYLDIQEPVKENSDFLKKNFEDLKLTKFISF